MATEVATFGEGGWVNPPKRPAVSPPCHYRVLLPLDGGGEFELCRTEGPHLAVDVIRTLLNAWGPQAKSLRLEVYPS